MDVVHHPGGFAVVRLPVFQRPPHVPEPDAARRCTVSLDESVAANLVTLGSERLAIVLGLPEGAEMVRQVQVEGAATSYLPVDVERCAVMDQDVGGIDVPVA